MKIVFPGLEKTKVNGINLKRRREEVLEDPELDRGGSRSQHREHHNLQFNIIKMPGLVLCISTHPHSFSDAFYSVRPPPTRDSPVLGQFSHLSFLPFSFIPLRLQFSYFPPATTPMFDTDPLFM